jgi:hypothetical protein
VIIDSTHKRWIFFTLLLAVLSGGAYGWLYETTPGGLTGGSFVGLWYGVAGSVLMIFAGALSGLRKVPSWWWIGSRKAWLKGHIWLGLLSVLLILCHSGFRVGGPLTQALWVVFGLTIVTGVFGLVLQQFLPRQLTTAVPCEAPYEQIPHLCARMRLHGDGLIREVWNNESQDAQMSILLSQMGAGAKIQLQEFYEQHVRPFLQERSSPTSLMATPARADAAFTKLLALPGLATAKEQVSQMRTLCDERRLLAEQERLHGWLHGWLLVHVPLSVALLVLSIAHVVMALYY